MAKMIKPAIAVVGAGYWGKNLVRIKCTECGRKYKKSKQGLQII